MISLVFILQVNKVSIWSVADQQLKCQEPGLLPSPEGEPELLCEANHTGDVLDLQVSLCVPPFIALNIPFSFELQSSKFHSPTCKRKGCCTYFCVICFLNIRTNMYTMKITKV